jgi:hypothetical protein
MQDEEADAYCQSMAIHQCTPKYSPPRLSRKRKSRTHCLIIPTEVTQLCPDFFVPDLEETDSEDEERKVQSTEFKLYPRRQSRLKALLVDINHICIM